MNRHQQRESKKIKMLHIQKQKKYQEMDPNEMKLYNLDNGKFTIILKHILNKMKLKIY